MALEDVVQGVQVSVKSDGVDDAKGKIGELDKAIGNLAKTAEGASGSGSGSGGSAGIGGLSKAFGDLNIVSAQAFATIARSATSGDITGLATMMGGPVAGSFVEAGKAISEFISTQDASILKNAAMAKEFGTTPSVIQGMREGFEGAGVSVQGFERLINRMSRQVTNDYADMTRNIRTDSDTQESALLRLQASREKLAISKGADPAQFVYADKLREQKFAQIAVDQAEEGVRQQALKSIPHVTELLQEGTRAHQQNAEITEVSVKTLRESIEHMAQTGAGPASPIDVLKKEFDLIKSGAIDADKAFQLLTSQSGSMRAAGMGGMDTQHEVEYAKKYGGAGITAAQAGATEIQKLGLGQTATDTKKATETISEWSKFTGLMGATMQKIGASMSGDDSILDTTLKSGEGMIRSLVEWRARLQAASDAATPQPGDRPGAAGMADRAKRWSAAFTGDLPETPVEKPESKGTPGHPAQAVTRERIGSGPGQIIHVPEGYGGPDSVTKVTETPIGSGPGKMIQVPEDYGAPPKQPTFPTVPGGPQYEHMSVTDDPNAPWRSLRSGGGAASPAPAAPAISDGGIVSALTNIASRIMSVQIPAAVGQEPSATAPIPKWQGGYIPGLAGGGRVRGSYLPGFASGGRVSTNFSSIPGFAEGGSPNLSGETEAEKQIWAQIKQAPGAVINTLKELGPAKAVSWLAEKGIKYGAESLLLAAGMTPQGRAIEIGAGALMNVIEPVKVGAADSNAGARQTEEAARALGAHNLKEMDDLGMWTGGIPGFATGSIRGSGTGTSDSILARLSNGEFVMKDAAVRTYGEGFMHAINNMQIPPPKYAYGGMIPSSSLPHFAESGGMERPGSTLNLHVGGEVFKGLKAPAAVADQLRKFAIDQQTTQTGKKPSWAGG